MTTQELEKLQPRLEQIGQWIDEINKAMPTAAEMVELAYALTGLTLECNGLIDELRSMKDVQAR